MIAQEDIKRIPPYAAVLEQLFGAALSEVEITHCEFTSRGPQTEVFEDEGGLGSMHSVQPPQEVVVEGEATGALTPALSAVFGRCDADLRFGTGVSGGLVTQFTIRRTIPGVSLPPPLLTLDAAQADPTFQELPEPEQEAAGRFLERVDEPDPAQMKTGQSLDTLAVNFNMARTDGETDAQLRKRIRTTMATNKRVIA